MVEPQQIVHAIASHAKWKFYLRQAIETATSEWTVAGVRQDDQCEFGKWLRSLPSSGQASEHWQEVRRLHTEFHEEASAVLKLALARRRQEAEAAIAPGGRFASVSSRLTIAMTAWQRAVEAAAGDRPLADH